ncbi:MAG: DUF1441 family protein [Methylobacter sp.]|uniref:DUF1441 family protein n=1 Tax=Methylobacter sp. TaxID=2051955 RepID=UPI0025FC9C38|nr:DUF1441 family protein [Methylobacter sp.]MCK9622229.1 DUF1441 family protein [Methylobacter sp.]
MAANNVSTLDSWRYYSLNKLSIVFGIARETVGKRLVEASVQPAGYRDEHAVYEIGQAARAILIQQRIQYDASIDPDKMPPKERRDWYEGNLAKKKDALAEGALVDAEDCRQRMADLIKPGIQLLDSLPDILERDFNISPEAIIAVERRIDALRVEWAEQIEAL